MSEVEVTDSIIEIIDDAREEALENARSQVETAMELFSLEYHEPACFLAMTAVEEAGKVGLLQFIRMMRTPLIVDTSELRSILSNHQKKALRSAASALCVNNRARRIYGTYPDSDFQLKDGLLLLARSGNEWMRIRGHCLYTDLDLHAKSLSTPIEEISSDYAYYFICMAGEVVAEEAERGFGSIVEGREPTRSHEFWQSTKEIVDEFVEEYGSEFDPSNIHFFTDPRFAQTREDIAEPIEMTEEDIESTIQQSVERVKIIGRIKGKSDEEIEQRASELRSSLEDSYPESIPSKECMTEFERLAEDVNAVVASSDG